MKISNLFIASFDMLKRNVVNMLSGKTKKVVYPLTSSNLDYIVYWNIQKRWTVLVANCPENSISTTLYWKEWQAQLEDERRKLLNNSCQKTLDCVTDQDLQEILHLKINHGLHELVHTRMVEKKSESIDRKLQWTASRTAMIELVYALHASQVFNHGTCTLKTIMLFFAQTFDKPLGQYHRAYIEIKDRKEHPLKFLHQLMESLKLKMDHEDGI